MLPFPEGAITRLRREVKMLLDPGEAESLGALLAATARPYQSTVAAVYFDTAAGDDYNFVFSGVAEPAEVVHTVDQATRTAGTDGVGSAPTAVQDQR